LQQQQAHLGILPYSTLAGLICHHCRRSPPAPLAARDGSAASACLLVLLLQLLGCSAAVVHQINHLCVLLLPLPLLLLFLQLLLLFLLCLLP
jgi:hypothetical protein